MLTLFLAGLSVVSRLTGRAGIGKFVDTTRLDWLTANFGARVGIVGPGVLYCTRRGRFSTDRRHKGPRSGWSSPVGLGLEVNLGRPAPQCARDDATTRLLIEHFFAHGADKYETSAEGVYIRKSSTAVLALAATYSLCGPPPSPVFPGPLQASLSS